MIRESGGAHAVGRLLAEMTGEPLKTVQSRVRGWVLENSIPGEYWATVCSLGVASLNELASAAEARKLPEIAAQRLAYGVGLGELHATGHGASGRSVGAALHESCGGTCDETSGAAHRNIPESIR